MISAGTLHAISTELVVGMFVLSGFCFLLCMLDKGPEVKANVAHWALLGGLLATPAAIITGVLAAPGEGIENPLLANKLLLSMSAVGLAIGVLLRRRMGVVVDRLHSGMGMVSVGLILFTAGIGGEFARGETLIFFIPKETVFLFPIWVSAIILILGMVILGKSAIQHRG
jgi:hypothetical protein